MRYYWLAFLNQSTAQVTEGKSVSGMTVKPLSIVAAALLIGILFAILLPVLAYWNRAQSYQVSVTALSASAVRDQAGDAGSEVFIAPPTTDQVSGDLLEKTGYPGLGRFATALMNGQAGDVVGVYVSNVMALPVEQQPAGSPEYVSIEHNQLTQFAMPKEYGTIGILAHNYLSGSRFPQLGVDTEVVVVYGNGRIERYRVERIERYQALKPTSPFSDFVDVRDPDQRVLTSAELFRRIYTTPNQLVLQTCIEAAGETSWGRMFVVATRMDPLQLTVPQLEAQLNLN
jgi:hypothetical protein